MENVTLSYAAASRGSIRFGSLAAGAASLAVFAALYAVADLYLWFGRHGWFDPFLNWAWFGKRYPYWEIIVPNAAYVAGVIFLVMSQPPSRAKRRWGGLCIAMALGNGALVGFATWMVYFSTLSFRPPIYHLLDAINFCQWLCNLFLLMVGLQFLRRLARGMEWRRLVILAWVCIGIASLWCAIYLAVFAYALALQYSLLHLSPFSPVYQYIHAVLARPTENLIGQAFDLPLLVLWSVVAVAAWRERG